MAQNHIISGTRSGKTWLTDEWISRYGINREEYEPKVGNFTFFLPYEVRRG